MTIGASELGTVLAVDKTLGTVDAELRSGTRISGAKYQGAPPWRDTEARFEEVADGAWICQGSSGDTGGYGPNLCANGDFEMDVTGWDNTASTPWNFDGTTEAWVALASTSIAVETTYVYNGAGSLKITATAGATVGATSPTGAAGVSGIVPGTSYNVTAWTRNNPTLNARVCQVRIKWYTGAGAFVSDSAFGTTITTDGAAWGAVACTATAPATAGRAAVEVQYVAAALGDVFYLDTVVITGGSSATITRDTTVAYAGAGSMRIRSSAAGLAYAQTPTPATDPLAGYPCAAGDVFYTECRFRTSVAGAQMFIVAAWVAADGSTTADFDSNSRSPGGSTTAWQHHLQTFVAPSNAVAVHFAFAFLPTAATQDLFIDAVRIRQALIQPGTGSQAVIPDNYTWSVGQKAQQPGTLLFVPSETDYPRAVINGYVQGRALRARLYNKSGAVQNITSDGNWNGVTMTDQEQNGMVASAFLSLIVLPRTGIYRCSGQVQWNLIFATAATGWRAMRLTRWSAAGVLIEAFAGVQQNGEAVTADTLPQNCSMEIPANRDESIRMQVAASHGSSVINLSPAVGAATGHALAVTYVGDF